MSENSTPCYGCTDRKVVEGNNCHSDCPRYLEYKDKRLKRSKVICLKRNEESMLADVHSRSVRRVTKRSRKKG